MIGQVVQLLCLRLGATRWSGCLKAVLRPLFGRTIDAQSLRCAARNGCPYASFVPNAVNQRLELDISQPQTTYRVEAAALVSLSRQPYQQPDVPRKYEADHVLPDSWYAIQRTGYSRKCSRRSTFGDIRRADRPPPFPSNPVDDT